ncbi:VWFA domain-containing protein OS=Bosea thiooxidans OX=53254 GN=ARD30_21165 PE=4 SV=1 [Bosea thiooxidans]
MTAMRRVIDISGDGADDERHPVTAARDEAGAKGIAINGLPVMLKQAGYFDIDNLDAYYTACDITGLGAFVIPIREKSQFVEATKTKLLREIAEAPADATFHRAKANNPAACLAGEQQWRDRMGN